MENSKSREMLQRAGVRWESGSQGHVIDHLLVVWLISKSGRANPVNG